VGKQTLCFFENAVKECLMLLEAIDIAKQFGKEQVLEGVQVSLPAGGMLSVLGRSGSGKTTLLKILAGLESSDRGKIVLDGEDITHWPPQKRGIVYLYQEPLLFPHLNVFENVAFGLRLRAWAEADIRREVEAMLADLELTEQADKAPHQLSGGQKQRAAFGRALIIRPRVLLLDEPFGALDAETRALMQALFVRLAGAMQLTAIFVTHDLKEALTMSSRTGLMQSGALKVYESRRDFLNEAGVGVQQEMNFWLNLFETEAIAPSTQK
jgi:putrescine transport system ATP-binding protein